MPPLNTYTAYAESVNFAQGKVLVLCFNRSGSNLLMKIWRIICLNNNFTAVTGTLTNIEIRRVGGFSSSGPIIKITPHKTTNPAINLNKCIFSTAAEIQYSAIGDLIKRFVWSTDEITAPGNVNISIDEFQAIPMMCTVWDSGYRNPNMSPIVCREGEGIILLNVGAYQGAIDIGVEFTLEQL